MINYLKKNFICIILLSYTVMAGNFSSTSQVLTLAPPLTMHLLLQPQDFIEEIKDAIAKGDQPRFLKLCKKYEINFNHYDLHNLHEIFYCSAVHANQPEMILLLIELKAFISKTSLAQILNFVENNCASHTHEKLLQRLFNYTDEEANSLLHVAVMYQDIDSIKKILALQPSMKNSINQDNHTPLDLILKTNIIQCDNQAKEIINNIFNADLAPNQNINQSQLFLEVTEEQLLFNNTQYTNSTNVNQPLQILPTRGEQQFNSQEDGSMEDEDWIPSFTNFGAYF